MNLVCHTNQAKGAIVSEATAQEIERFNAKWIRVGDCMVWQGNKDRDGYGVFAFRRASRKAHRVAMFLAGREIPDGFVVNHTCRNRACVNTQHLNAISASENSKRDSTSVGYINSQKTHCKSGHPYDRFYGGQRYCSQCEAEKGKRLRAKWKADGIFKI
jgi:hypothetical protein